MAIKIVPNCAATGALAPRSVRLSSRMLSLSSMNSADFGKGVPEHADGGHLDRTGSHRKQRPDGGKAGAKDKLLPGQSSFHSGVPGLITAVVTSSGWSVCSFTRSFSASDFTVLTGP